jgi:hypothetical protein
MAEGAGELCSEEAKANKIDLHETSLLAQSSVEVSEPVVEPETRTAFTNNEPESGVQQQIDDDVPLASEVEMSPDIADEIKHRAARK